VVAVTPAQGTALAFAGLLVCSVVFAVVLWWQARSARRVLRGLLRKLDHRIVLSTYNDGGLLDLTLAEALTAVRFGDHGGADLVVAPAYMLRIEPPRPPGPRGPDGRSYPRPGPARGGPQNDRWRRTTPT